MIPDDARPEPGRAGLRLRQLAGRKALAPVAALESAGACPPEALDPDRRRDSLGKLRAVLAERVVANPATPLGADEADVAVREADRALRQLADEGPEAQLSPSQDMMLEAVIEVDGSRPSIPVTDGFIDLDNPMLGDWRDDLATAEAAVRRAIASTGRLIRGGDLSEGAVYGTGWVIAPGLVATAQHVLEELYTLHDGQWIERFGGEIAIDFRVEADRPADPAHRVRVVGVERPSPDLIRGALNLSNLDAAILRLDPAGPEHPPPLTHALDIAPHGSPRIHVIGHPARPLVAPDDPAVPVDALTAMTERIVQLVFGDSFGVKRWSPGEFLTNPGALPGDTHGRVMTHDASTLGGNSGSPVFDFFAAPDRVVGLHYAGRFREANYCHPTARIAAHFDRPGVRFA